MKAKLVHSWVQTEELRNSMPNIICNTFFYLYDDNSNSDNSKSTQSLTQLINRRFFKYKAPRYIYKKTSIPPSFFLYTLVIGLLLIMICFFDNLLVSLIATIYPIYNSIKALECKYIGELNPDGKTYYTMEDNEEDIRLWLTYWVVYAIFMNFECLFGFFLKYIPFYFFIKVLFLLACFLPNYQLSKWLYNNIIKWWFRKYERDVVEISEKILKTFKLKNDSISITNEFSFTSNLNSKCTRIKENTRYDSIESDTVYNNPFI